MGQRLLAGLLAVGLAAAGIAAVVLVLQARDDAEVAGPEGPGRKVAARCPGERANILRDRRELTQDQIRHALALGNVVLVSAGPGSLRELQEEISGPFDAEIAAAGQGVILARDPDTKGVVALAWGRELQVSSHDDPQLRAFAEAWLGEGAAQPCS